jgi:hypothetical protein
MPPAARGHLFQIRPTASNSRAARSGGQLGCPDLFNAGVTGHVCLQLGGAPAKAGWPPVETVHRTDVGRHGRPEPIENKDEG